MGILSILAEGGQTWAHRVRMIRQVLKIAILTSVIVGAASFAYQMSQLHPSYYKALWYNFQSAFRAKGERIPVNREYWETAINQKIPPSQEVFIEAEKLHKISEKHTEIFYRKAWEKFQKSLYLSAWSFICFILFFIIRGKLARRRKLVSGQYISPTWKVRLLLKLKRIASDISIGKLPLVKGTETQHILISGGTGSGKTNCLHHLLPQIRAKKQRAIVVDTTGAFVLKYYREGKDIILNPFDSRSSEWHPWIECRDLFDYDSMAASFIPTSSHEQENFWRNAARSVFSALLQKTSDSKKISEAVNLLLYEPLSALSSFLQGTKACSHLDVSSEKTAASIRSVATTYLESLEFLKDSEGPFSIREWVENSNADSWLFITSKVSQRASLTPLLSSWFSIAGRSLLHTDPSLDRRLWFIIDELPSLQRLKDFETLLTEGRKFGACVLFALQSPAQLEMIYGFEAAKIIMGNCSTRVAFSEQDPEIAEKISKGFGESETMEYQEGISYGANDIRDGVNLSLQTKNRRAVSATDIQSLEKHNAFIRLPGNIPITKVHLKIAR